MKLFLITREDLSINQQAVQLCHALREFTATNPVEDRQWYEQSNVLVLLAVPNETRLLHLLERAQLQGTPAAGFREPDRENELTAIALGPTAKKLCRGLPLALREGMKRQEAPERCPSPREQ